MGKKLLKILLHILSWAGALSAFVWIIILGYAIVNIHRLESLDYLIIAHVILLVLLGLYLCVVAFRKVYLKKGLTPTRPQKVCRYTASIIVIITSAHLMYLDIIAVCGCIAHTIERLRNTPIRYSVIFEDLLLTLSLLIIPLAIFTIIFAATGWKLRKEKQYIDTE